MPLYHLYPAVLPYSTPHSKTVYFPDLPYSTKFWQAIQKSPHHSVARFFPINARAEIKPFIPCLPLFSIPKDWEKKEKIFFKTFKEMGLFQQELKKVASITVLLTPYGTAGSFHHTINKSGRINIFVTHRQPASSMFLAQTIILSLLALKEKLPSRYLLDSQKYLKKLGFAQKKKLRLIDNEVFYEEKKISQKLSPQESEVLKKLAEKPNKIISHDQLAKILWRQNAEEKFSLWAVAKIIEKIRRKIRSLGINHQLIATIYGKGYQLTE